MEGFRRHRDRIRFLLVHHEEAAAFMATGHAKSTGRLGVCLATSGPGGLHLINGLYDAKLDHAPVLAIPAPTYNQPIVVPHEEDVRRAADVLNDGSKVVKSLSGKAAVPDHHPLVTGGLGLLGTKPSVEAMEDCDTLLMIGTNFPYTTYVPYASRRRPDRARGDTRRQPYPGRSAPRRR